MLGCGIISWKPPPGNEGLALNYVIRFFDGSSYSDSASSYRTIQRHPEDIGRHWARAENLPTDGRTIYADVSVDKPVLLISQKTFRSEQEMEMLMAHSHKHLLLLVSCFIQL